VRCRAGHCAYDRAMADHMLSFHVLLPGEMHGRLQAYAHRRGMVASEVIRRALAKHLDDELGRGAGAAAPANVEKP
jgi:hypothetical protein